MCLVPFSVYICTIIKSSFGDTELFTLCTINESIQHGKYCEHPLCQHQASPGYIFRWVKLVTLVRVSSLTIGPCDKYPFSYNHLYTKHINPLDLSIPLPLNHSYAQRIVNAPVHAVTLLAYDSLLKVGRPKYRSSVCSIGYTGPSRYS